MKKMLALGLLAMMVLSGCASNEKKDDADVPDATGLTKIQDRHKLDFVVGEAPWSQTLEKGPFGILSGIGATVDFDMPLGTGAPTATVHMGLFFPEIEGCDWPDSVSVGITPDIISTPAMREYPEHCRLPVVADVGPYYGQEEKFVGVLDFDGHATEPAGRLGRFLIESLVPHGYIIAQVSVTGTGDSTGCMDLMGPVEQAGVQAAVRFLGDAGWSNGNVGLIGRSYDGSTPWEAAAAADLPQLKTVVPISGLYGQMDLMWRNGSVETRGPGLLWGIYYVFTYTGNEPVSDPDHFDAGLKARQLVENALCADTHTGAAHAAAAYLYGGDPYAMEGASYWAERSFKDAVLQHYEGSVYFIHGMQDWNVDPHMAFPFYQELQAKGLDVKGLFGQWGHNYPDRVSEHDHLRWDWAQDLLEWFDYYLYNGTHQPQLVVEMEDDRRQWRLEDTWPPADLSWQVIEVPGSAGAQVQEQASVPFTGIAAPLPCQGHSASVSPSCWLRFDLGPVENDTRIAGLPKFHVDVVPQGPGGQLYAELRDKTDDRRLGHAIMDLRYAAGGTEMRPVVPGQTITAMMEFFPFDTLVPAGHELELRLHSTGRDYLPSAVSAKVDIDTGDLKLPVIPDEGRLYYTPPGWDLEA